ncbi:gamma carbonic anhydrase family protein [Thiohalocapsa marina]|uniref:Gamma carbonic anhydrase family protein n=1 Tax=Thiohalocapsa marina TaxID=424902 RepID=A0A5M8FDE8_9GAMM|nr:gamma carbonic anhydrase family protein [Thiohalocapsa marina]KAA6182697.1 gamma carbonic anhydrase family protein [Thiohalocapsa marina]
MNNVRSYQGLDPRIAPSAYVDETAVVIGDVHIGPQASIWPMAVVRGDIHRIRIGAGTNVQDGSVLHVSHDSRFLPGGAPTILHDRVTVGHQAMLHGCEIHDLCLIGIGARVLDRAVLKPRVMLAAGAVVPPGKVLEGGYLYVGAPAKRTRMLTDLELEYLGYAAAHYMELALKHRATAA